MKYAITTTIELDRIRQIVQQLDPNALVVDESTKSDLEILCDTICSDPLFAVGLVNGDNIESVIRSGVAVGMSLVDQVRYNGASIEISTDLEHAVGRETVRAIIDLWVKHLSGDLLHEVEDLFVIALFGLTPDERVIEAFKNFEVQCSNMDHHAQLTIFSNYSQFVNEALSGKRSVLNVIFDIEEGYDS